MSLPRNVRGAFGECVAINYGSRARIGMLLPSGNQAAEPFFSALLPPGIAVHTTRLKLTGNSERELLAMTEKIEEAASLVADAGATLIVFHCTAVTTYDLELERSIKDRIERATGTPAIATSEALVAALKELKAKRIVMISPYTERVNEREATFFRAFGFDVLSFHGLDHSTADRMMAVSPEEWYAFSVAHRDDRTDAYVISCTTVRSAEAVDSLERELGKPVITSNTATAWYCLRRLGFADAIPHFGRLLDKSREAIG